MSYRVILYQLQSDKTGKTYLNYDLNSEDIVISNNLESLVIRLNEKLYTIDKPKWVNSMKVYDTGRQFFLICTKSVNTNYAFQVLMKYAMSKIDTRIEFLQTIKLGYQKELSQLKLKAA